MKKLKLFTLLLIGGFGLSSTPVTKADVGVDPGIDQGSAGGRGAMREQIKFKKHGYRGMRSYGGEGGCCHYGGEGGGEGGHHHHKGKHDKGMMEVERVGDPSIEADEWMRRSTGPETAGQQNPNGGAGLELGAVITDGSSTAVQRHSDDKDPDLERRGGGRDHR